MPGRGGRSRDYFYGDTGYVPTTEDERSIEAKALPAPTRGRRAEQGTEIYVEVKGPSGLGQRSSTPYTDVLPKYEKKAEQAIRRDKIPKRHQKRVKDYFDSLQEGD